MKSGETHLNGWNPWVRVVTPIPQAHLKWDRDRRPEVKQTHGERVPVGELSALAHSR